LRDFILEKTAFFHASEKPGFLSPLNRDWSPCVLATVTENPEKTAPKDAKDPQLPFCGDLDICIKADGTWYYQGSPIGRLALVKLFASVLHRKENGDYWLITPVEQVRIQVEDAPFTAVEVDVQPAPKGKGREFQIVRFRTNLDAFIELGPKNRLIVRQDAFNKGPNPYIIVREKLEARLLRSVFYHLVNYGEEQTASPSQHSPGQAFFGVWSHGIFHPLGELEEEV